MKNFWLVLVFATIIAGFSACKGGGDLSKSAATSIPENAAAVISIDLKSLMEKADIDAMIKMDFYKDMVADAARQQGETMAKILENPELSGVDLTQNAYFFAQMESETQNGLVGFVFKIADEGKFETLVKESDMEVIKGKGFRFANTGDNVVAWGNATGFVGSITNSYDEVDAEATLTSIFNLKKSIVDNEKASKALKSKHDINYYFSTETIVDLFENEVEMGEFVGISKADLKNNSFSGYTDFNKGEILSDGIIQLSKNIKSDLRMIFGDGSKTDFSEYITGENLMTLMTAKLNFKGINQLLKDKNVSGYANTYLASAGISTEDIAAAIDGDIAVAMNTKKGSNDPSALMVLKIGDRTKLDKLLKKGVDLNILTKIGNDTYAIKNTDLGIPSGKFLIKKEVLIFSNNAETLAKLEKGGLSKSERVSSSIYKNANGVFGMFMNYQVMAKGLAASPISENGIETLQYSVSWDKSSGKIIMADKSKNSLQVLIEAMNNAYKKNRDNREQLDNEWEDGEEKIKM